MYGFYFFEQDPKTGNWWLRFGNLSPLGYWPSFLFPSLTSGGSAVQWGGEIKNSNLNGQHTTTKMGGGQFPEQGHGKASYIKNIQIVDKSNRLQYPQHINAFMTRPNCYRALNYDDGDGRYFFGGPGRNANCP